MTWREALGQAASTASVIALVFCIAISPIVDATVEPLSANLSDDRVATLSVEVSWRLFWTWLVTFVAMLGALLAGRVRPRLVSKPANLSTP